MSAAACTCADGAAAVRATSDGAHPSKDRVSRMERKGARGGSGAHAPDLVTSTMATELDADVLPTLRARIFDVLKDADLSSVSAKKIRTEMAEMPEGSLPAGLDLTAQKKAIDAVIRQCYEEFTSKKKPTAKSKKSAEPKPKEEEKTKKRTSASDKEGEPKKKRVASENSPLKRPMKLSAEMAEVCGGSEMPRYEVVKQLWVYIKEKNLQNESNKRQVRAVRLTTDFVR